MGDLELKPGIQASVRREKPHINAQRWPSQWNWMKEFVDGKSHVWRAEEMLISWRGWFAHATNHAIGSDSRAETERLPQKPGHDVDEREESVIVTVTNRAFTQAERCIKESNQHHLTYDLFNKSVDGFS